MRGRERGRGSGILGKVDFEILQNGEGDRERR